MRIALVVTGGFDRSGRERVIPALLALVERLARRHDVCVYALRYHDRPCSYTLQGATVHDLGRPEGMVRQYWSLVQALKRDGPFDVLHAYWALPAGLVTAIAGRRLRVPTVITADSGEFVSLPDIGYGLQQNWHQRQAVTAALRLATCVTVCTRAMERLAREHGCTPLVIPIGVDCERFQPPDADASGPNARASGDSPPWRLLHVASLNRVKDQSLLLHAFRLVVDGMSPDSVHLDIVGEDTLHGAVQGVARTLSLDTHVTFHGWLPTDALIPFYQHAHAVVVSSRHEAASVTALEAAATGVPVVGRSVGYLDDWSPHAAETAQPDAAALAAAIIVLLRQPARRRALALSARAWARAHDADWTAAQFERLYAELSQRA